MNTHLPGLVDPAASGATINGETRLFVIVGSPIAQVRSPQVFNPLFAARGRNAVMLPVELDPHDFDASFASLLRWRNLDGVVVTVPFKLAALHHADVVSAAGHRAGCVNALRRMPQGLWAADLFDGAGFVHGLAAQGHGVQGRTALVLGAGGAGSAIAAALLQGGAGAVDVFDTDCYKAEALAKRLQGLGSLGLCSAPPHAGRYDLLVNATPLGMQATDPLPLALDGVRSGSLVAEAVMKPPITRWLETAHQRGAQIHEGRHMLAGQTGLLVDYLLGADPVC